jgi:hypothetical protein
VIDPYPELSHALTKKQSACRHWKVQTMACYWRTNINLASNSKPAAYMLQYALYVELLSSIFVWVGGGFDQPHLPLHHTLAKMDTTKSSTHTVLS